MRTVIPFRWLAALLLPACVPTAPELPPAERAAIHAAIDGWREAGLPEPDAVRCDFTRTRVRTAKPDDRCPTPGHDGCLQWESSDHWFRWVEYPVVVARPGWLAADNPFLIIHELMHAMARCAGMPSDIGHDDPRVWAEAGGETSAQGRAVALLLLRPGAW